MAVSYSRDDTDFGEREVREGDKTTKEKHDEASFMAEARARYDRGWLREEGNIKEAYEDLDFRAGNQWPSETKQQREEAHRPVLTINLLPQFIRQVTGDMRIMRPSVKVVGVDNRADKGTADILGGMIRYIENRSEAQYAYMVGADSQVACGVGHWQINHEYADQSTFNQELMVSTVEDGVAVIWDPDDHSPVKERARFCFVPFDCTRDAFKEQWPDKVPSDVSGDSEYRWMPDWVSEDFIRVAIYWEVRKEMKTLCLNQDGSIDDLTGKDEEFVKDKLAEGGRIEEREGVCVYRSIISLTDVLEGPHKWPGRYIPIVRAVGEEVRRGREVYRHGVVRFAKDPQRAYNYFRSTQTEVVALQPKSPFIGTEKNFEGLENQWTNANTEPMPFLPYKPDPRNNGRPPERSSPAVMMTGIDEGLLVSNQEMMGTIGIYQAGLGQESNEKSGKAIDSRKREGEIGTFVYVDNFARALRHTGRILIDLIPHIYDTERVIRVVGVDGKVDIAEINSPTKDDQGRDATYNDVTVGAYDVVLETGPSYTTRREEAREGMMEMINRSPEMAGLIGDLVAEAQNWPLADKIAKRMKTMLPPQIQMQEAQEAGEPPPQLPEPPPPPEVQKAMAEVEAEKIRTASKHETDMANMLAKHELSMEQMTKDFEARILQIILEANLKRDVAIADAETREGIELDNAARADAIAAMEGERGDVEREVEEDRKDQSTEREERRKDRATQNEEARRDAAAVADRARRDADAAAERTRKNANGSQSAARQ